MMDEKKWDMKVKKLQKTDSQDEKCDKITYSLVAESSDGLTRISIVSVVPFGGSMVKDVISVRVLNSQLTLSDFEEEE